MFFAALALAWSVPSYAEDVHYDAVAADIVISLSDTGRYDVEVVLHSDLTGMRLLDLELVIPAEPEVTAIAALPAREHYVADLQPGRQVLGLDVGVRRWRGVRSA
jgi:hypothetical protein